MKSYSEIADEHARKFKLGKYGLPHEDTRAYQNHYWFSPRRSNEFSREPLYFVRCLLCGYPSFEGDRVFATCQKREPE